MTSAPWNSSLILLSKLTRNASVRASPIGFSAFQWVQQVGLFMLVGLMGFAMWNDVSRYWLSFFDWLRNL